MMNWEPIATHVMSAVVGGGLVVWLLKTFIREKLRAAIQHEYDEKLESFRAAQERRLASVETFWKAMVHLRVTTPIPVAMIDMFPDEKYRNGTVFRNDMLGLSSGSLTLESLADQDQDIETDRQVQLARALGDEYMYALFFAYRALIKGISMRLLIGKKYGTMQPWFEDEGIRMLLETIFTEKEMQAFDADPHLRYRRVQTAIEGKMLAHINDIVTGKTLSQSLLEHASTMLGTAVKLQRE